MISSSVKTGKAGGFFSVHSGTEANAAGLRRLFKTESGLKKLSIGESLQEGVVRQSGMRRSEEEKCAAFSSIG